LGDDGRVRKITRLDDAADEDHRRVEEEPSLRLRAAPRAYELLAAIRGIAWL